MLAPGAVVALLAWPAVMLFLQLMGLRVLAAGPVRVDLLALGPILTPGGGVVVVAAVLLVGRDVGSGAIGVLLGTGVPRSRLVGHAWLATAAVGGAVGVPVVVALAALDGAGWSGAARSGAAALVMVGAFAAPAVGALILLRNDVFVVVAYLAVWEGWLVAEVPQGRGPGLRPAIGTLTGLDVDRAGAGDPGLALLTLVVAVSVGFGVGLVGLQRFDGAPRGASH